MMSLIGGKSSGCIASACDQQMKSSVWLRRPTAIKEGAQSQVHDSHHEKNGEAMREQWDV
jgi:hypothetical protein